MTPNPTGLRPDSETDIRNGLLHTDRQTDIDVGSDLLSTHLGRRAREADEFTTIGDVLAIGLWPGGERHPVVRKGERAPIASHVRAAIWYRDHGQCRMCPPGQVDGVWHLDHIKPWSAGGSDRSENLRILCERHNLERSNYVIAEERQELPATWWCSRCYMGDDHVWDYRDGLPRCPQHPWFTDLTGDKPVPIRSPHCSVQRGYLRSFDADGLWPTWHQLDRGLEPEDLGTIAYCAHCHMPGVTGVTL